MMTKIEFDSIAKEVVASLESRSQIPTFSSRSGGLTLTQAYQVIPLLRMAFEARGERIIGRKIGFTNRNMWKAFGVETPIWGYITNRTARELSDVKTVFLKSFVDPRIEPEILFGLGASPTSTMSDAALMECVEWIALGYEIVQSIFPDWKFAAADTVAANAVHGGLLIGRRHAVAPRCAEWRRELAEFKVELYCDGTLVERGGGALVLDSPLLALRHLVGLLENDRHNPSLRAGEIVSTGTLTLAMPVKPGQRWSASVIGIPLEEISVEFN